MSTTSIKYLDENKQLILAILENQNSGKAEECAENLAKLQRNLAYLAAIADSQFQMPTVAQPPANAAMQSSGLHMNHQQQQPQPQPQQPQPQQQQQQQQQPQQPQQQMTPQSIMAARSSMLYAQSPMPALSQQQQQASMHGHLTMSSMPTGNSSSGGGFPKRRARSSGRAGKQESGGSHSSYPKGSKEKGNK